MSISRARELLGLAAAEPDRFRRYLIAAAALGEVMTTEPVIVGGAAEIYWTRSDYYQTDLDLVLTLTHADQQALRELGFEHAGRHWFRTDLLVYFEFPEADLYGDPNRVKIEVVQGSRVRIIGVDDLYLDRLRQTTAERPDGQRFHSALAIAGARYSEMDFKYIEQRIRKEIEVNPMLQQMRRTHLQILRKVRQTLG